MNGIKYHNHEDVQFIEMQLLVIYSHYKFEDHMHFHFVPYLCKHVQYQGFFLFDIMNLIQLAIL